MPKVNAMTLQKKEKPKECFEMNETYLRHEIIVPQHVARLANRPRRLGDRALLTMIHRHVVRVWRLASVGKYQSGAGEI